MTARELVTAAEAARRLGVPAGTVRSWIARRLLNPSGRDRATDLYDLEHVRTLANRTTRRSR